MLKDMVRARKSDARTRDLKSDVQRRRIRTDVPSSSSGGVVGPIEMSPSSIASGTPARRAPAANMMQAL